MERGVVALRPLVFSDQILFRMLKGDGAKTWSLARVLTILLLAPRINVIDFKGTTSAHHHRRRGLLALAAN